LETLRSDHSPCPIGVMSSTTSFASPDGDDPHAAIVKATTTKPHLAVNIS